MSFFEIVIIGVRLWIWIYFLFSLLFFGGILAWWKREQIRKFYYKVRFPEKLIRVVIHYPSNLYKVYWRLVPSDKLIKLDGKKYIYDKEQIGKDKELFIAKQKRDTGVVFATDTIHEKQKGNKQYFLIDFKEYEFKDFFMVREKGNTYPEIHYYFNNPFPIEFNQDIDKNQLAGEQLRDFIENDLLSKLLTLKGEKVMFMLMLILVGINLLATIFIILKMMGYIK